MAGTVMDRINEARDKAMVRAEQVKGKIGGGSGGRLLMGGGGGVGSNWGGIKGLQDSPVAKRIQEARTKIQTRIKGMGGGRTASGPMDMLFPSDKVEHPELKRELVPQSSKVIRV